MCADDMRALDAGMIHQGKDIAGHRLAVVPLGFVRLGALAVAAMVERQTAHSFGGDGVVPAHALPVLVFIRGKAVQQDDRFAGVCGAERVIGKIEAVGCELGHVAC